MDSDTVGVTAEEKIEQEIFASAWEQLPAKTQERLFALRDLTRKGITKEAIAKILNVSIRTIQRDERQLREIHRRYLDGFSQDEEIGESVQFFSELENKCMEGFRSAMEDHEELTWTADDAGKPVQQVRLLPDHQSANRHAAVALAARKAKIELLQKIGRMKIIPERIEIGGRIDISGLEPGQLKQHIADLDSQIERRRVEIARIQGASVVKARDPERED